MPLIRSLLLAFALFVSAPALAQEGDAGWFYRGSDIAPDPAWRFGTLPNGLRYAVRRNAIPAGQVAIRIRVDAGSLHETEAEQGWAHFVEHMLFRGTETYPDRQARHIWEQLGASFGSDSNAVTSATDTVYQLNLPRADRASLDTSLAVLAEMMSRARFDPAAIDAERPVVVAEKERRAELSQLLYERSRPLFYAGMKIGRHETIGTAATLAAADAAGLRAFYRRWYRPERTTIVLVGDADPAMLETLVRERFGGWRGEGANPPEPDYGRLSEPPSPVAAIAYPGAPATVTLMWLRPYETRPHTVAREQTYLEETLAARIVNRRLEAHARGESAYLNAGIGLSRSRGIANATSLSVSARGSDWRRALEESYAILTDALGTPPSTAEIARELSNIRAAARAAVQGETTVQSPSRADQLVNALDNGAVITTAATALANLDRHAPLMTPERVGAAMRTLFSGFGPRALLLTPEPVAGGERALAEGLAAAQRAAPAVRAADRAVSFDDLPAPAAPGREVARQRFDDIGVTLVRFANGATLTFKHTDIERGTVHVRLRFGAGHAGLAPDRESLAWLAGLVPPSGIGALDLDAMERLLTGRRISLSFGVDDDAFTLTGQANATELGDQMRLLTAKLVAPRWDAALLARFRTAAVESFDLHFSSAAARAARETGGVFRPGDRRWQPVSRDEMAAVTVDRFGGFFGPALAARPVHAVIVGDVTLEQAIEAVRRTTGALPAPRGADPALFTAVRPPAPNPQPRTFTHEGAPDQAYAMIGWSTFGGTGSVRERRALSLAANIVRMRLFDELRETEGASYSPMAMHSSSAVFPDWGVFYAAAELRPGRTDDFLRIARAIVADLAARAPAADEFARAQNPVLSGIERTFTTSNAWWVGAIEDFATRPSAVGEVRTYLSDYRTMTAEDVRAAVARHVAEQGDWSMLVLPARAAAAPVPVTAPTRPGGRERRP
ncbi:MAG TPA: insulinase family protein [Allosphingosinicella sp.]|nr:insulinase family protein [Allosphingosinicella sp.]